VAQVPQRNEIPEFWKQIWKHQVEHIVLLDDSSATKYWPQRNKITFDDFYIVLVSCKIFADYEHRKFILTREDQLHQVDQYRYVSWPKDGLPLSAVNLVPFIQKLSTIPLSSEYPILIQCRCVPRAQNVLFRLWFAVPI
jgi:protein tyrosine phosphatase